MDTQQDYYLVSIEKQKEFTAKHRRFFQSLPAINKLTDLAVKQSKPKDLADRIIIELAQLIFEDFEEIVTLTTVGFPKGALKLLRGMFERTVTLFEIDEHPEEAQAFFDYGHIDDYKVALEVREGYPGAISDDQFAELETARNNVKGNYMMACGECGHKRPAPSWHKTGIVEMGKKLGFKSFLIVPGYYWPLHETHPKMSAIFDRVADKIGMGAPDKTLATLRISHFFVLDTVRVLKERFKILEIEDLYQQCMKDFHEAWPASTAQ